MSKLSVFDNKAFLVKGTNVMIQTFEMMSDMDLNSSSDATLLHNIETEFNITLPKQYFSFMQLHNGGEGPIGEYGYLAIWDTEELMSFNQTNGFKDNLFYFASDRGGTLYAFDFNNHDTKIVELQEDEIDYSGVEIIANSFEEFISYIYGIDDGEYDI